MKMQRQKNTQRIKQGIKKKNNLLTMDDDERESSASCFFKIGI